MDAVLDEIKASLDKMEESGKADSVLRCIDRLEEHLVKVKSRWLEESDSDGFYFYLAARRVEMVTGRMRERLEGATKAGDNPKIATDSLAVLEPIRELMDAANTRVMDERSVDTVLERIHCLRSAATEADLRESMETCQALVDEDLSMRNTQKS